METPVRSQKAAAQPVLHAAALSGQGELALAVQRQSLQAEAQALQLPAGAIEQALQRQQDGPLAPVVPLRPQTTGDWITVMRAQAE